MRLGTPPAKFTVSVACWAAGCSVVGEKVTWKVLLAPAAMLVLPLMPVLAKAAAWAPVMLTLDTSATAPPELVIVTLTGALVVPTSCVWNCTEVGLMLSCGEPPPPAAGTTLIEATKGLLAGPCSRSMSRLPPVTVTGKVRDTATGVVLPVMALTSKSVSLRWPSMSTLKMRCPGPEAPPPVFTK